MTPLVTLTKRHQLGIVSINNPPVNALSQALRFQLCAAFADASDDREVEAIVLCCEGRTFVAGADIREFGKPPMPPDLPELVEFVDAMKKPSVAAIHGSALGGGLELALACDFRVATASAKLGFPEVSLGILPGAGGTQRLPRLIGLRPALDMVVGGLPVDATRAYELGLVDAIIHGDLTTGALAFAERLLSERTPLRKVSALPVKLEEPNLFEDYAAAVRERYRGFLAPLQCVHAIRAALELPFQQGLERERELFRELMQSPQSRAQRHVFFSEREVAKIPGLPDAKPTGDVKSVAVIGAGSTGTGIAICFADARIPVTLIDVAEDSLERAVAVVRQHYESAVVAGRLPPAELEERVGRIRPVPSYDGARNADLVVEAVFENLARKREVFATLDAVCKPGAILATTTSYLDIDQIAAATKRPGDVLGMHFGNPPHRVRLLENARARRTTPDVWATASKVGKILGKVTVPVLANPGFIGSRMLAQQLREAFFLLEEGALPEQVDGVFREFGFPLGPFAAADRDGLDTLWEQRKLNHERLTSREQACDIVDKISGRGRLGQKAGAGFYSYGSDGARTPDPAIEELLVEHSKARGIARRSIEDQEILERCLYAMINEGASILEEGVAARPLDIDMVWIHGYDFPTYRGGPMFHADELGLARVHRAILDFQTRFGPECWIPTPLIERLAKEGSGFYGAR